MLGNLVARLDGEVVDWIAIRLDASIGLYIVLNLADVALLAGGLTLLPLVLARPARWLARLARSIVSRPPAP